MERLSDLSFHRGLKMLIFFFDSINTITDHPKFTTSKRVSCALSTKPCFHEDFLVDSGRPTAAVQLYKIFKYSELLIIGGKSGDQDSDGVGLSNSLRYLSGVSVPVRSFE